MYSIPTHLLHKPRKKYLPKRTAELKDPVPGGIALSEDNGKEEMTAGRMALSCWKDTTLQAAGGITAKALLLRPPIVSGGTMLRTCANAKILKW